MNKLRLSDDHMKIDVFVHVLKAWNTFLFYENSVALDISSSCVYSKHAHCTALSQLMLISFIGFNFIPHIYSR